MKGDSLSRSCRFAFLNSIQFCPLLRILMGRYKGALIAMTLLYFGGET
jgi:hypothetical protein